MFVCWRRCILDGKYQQAMGVAVECRRLDKLEQAITSSDNVQAALSSCVSLSHSFVNRREYRCEVRTIAIEWFSFPCYKILYYSVCIFVVNLLLYLCQFFFIHFNPCLFSFSFINASISYKIDDGQYFVYGSIFLIFWVLY